MNAESELREIASALAGIVPKLHYWVVKLEKLAKESATPKAAEQPPPHTGAAPPQEPEAPSE